MVKRKTLAVLLRRLEMAPTRLAETERKGERFPYIRKEPSTDTEENEEKLVSDMEEAEDCSDMEEEEYCSEEEEVPVRYVAGQVSFPPAPHMQHLLRRRAEQLLDEEQADAAPDSTGLAPAAPTADIPSEAQQQEAARLFLSYQALTFQHQFVHQYSKRLGKMALAKARSRRAGRSPMRQNVPGMDGAAVAATEEEEQHLTDRQRLRMIFRGDRVEAPAAESVASLVAGLPPAWTVVQLSCWGQLAVTRFKETKKGEPSKRGNPELCLLRLRNDGGGVLLRRLAAPDATGVLPFFQELQSVIDENSHVMRSGGFNDDRKQYWQLRRELSDRMLALLKSAEERWLGPALAFLLGTFADRDAEAAVDSLVDEVVKLLLPQSSGAATISPASRAELYVILSAAPVLRQRELVSEVLRIVCASLRPEETKDLVMIEKKLARLISSRPEMLVGRRRNPVILILDPALQAFPWENLPALNEARQTVSRVPSLQFLRCLWEAHQATESSVVQSGVSSQNVFYVVNPDQTLPKTQERLDKALKGFTEMEGLMGRLPQPGQLAAVLCRKDALVYCGHGSGSAYISSDDIERLRVRAVPLLLGCSSGQLVQLGRQLDPLGTAQSYLMASAAALLGFLWPVSDKDVDNWTVELFQCWLSGSQPNLLQAAAEKKASFQFFFNAAAVVSYGLPVITTSSTSTKS